MLRFKKDISSTMRTHDDRKFQQSSRQSPLLAERAELEPSALCRFRLASAMWISCARHFHQFPVNQLSSARRFEVTSYYTERATLRQQRATLRQQISSLRICRIPSSRAPSNSIKDLPRCLLPASSLARSFAPFLEVPEPPQHAAAPKRPRFAFHP